MAKELGLDNWKKYTGHCWRRTGATCLADEGISEVALKRGDWKSATVAMRYTNTSRVAREKQLGMLNFNSKKQHIDEKDALAKAEKLHRVDKHYPCGSSASTNNINVVDSLTAQKRLR